MSFTSKASGGHDPPFADGGPALCNVGVTHSCNATCDFCNFAFALLTSLPWGNDIQCWQRLYFRKWLGPLLRGRDAKSGRG
jgi:hypothetical protein